jgi:hypothetical protein
MTALEKDLKHKGHDVHKGKTKRIYFVSLFVLSPAFFQGCV